MSEKQQNGEHAKVTPNPNPIYVDVKTLSFVTGLKIDHIYRLCKKGAPHLQETEDRGSYRFVVKDFEKWYKRQYGKGAYENGDFDGDISKSA